MEKNNKNAFSTEFAKALPKTLIFVFILSTV